MSQCMIVKNEEKNIEQALSWGKGIFFEQIVVDTGSTDRTVELAKKMGAIVYFFPWIDDFAAAKNFALEQAKGKWIAFLDADEYFLKRDRKKLKQTMELLDKGFILIDGVQRKGNALLCALVNLDQEGNAFSTEKQVRIFRNDKNIRYVGKIHEQITGLNGTNLIMADISEELSIFHTGYDLGEEDKLQKAERNIRLLKKQLELEPDNADFNYYMADSLLFKGDKKESMKYVKKVLENKKELTVMNGMEKLYSKILKYILNGTEDKEENLQHMKWFYKEAIETNPIYPDFDLFLAFGYLRKAKDWHQALYYFEKSLEKLEKEENRTNGNRSSSYIEQIYYYLVLGYLKEENKVKCVQNAVIYCKINKFNEEILRILLFLLKEDTCESSSIYQFLSQIYQFKEKKDSLFVQKAALLEGMIELVEILKIEQEHVLS